MGIFSARIMILIHINIMKILSVLIVICIDIDISDGVVVLHIDFHIYRYSSGLVSFHNDLPISVMNCLVS